MKLDDDWGYPYDSGNLHLGIFQLAMFDPRGPGVDLRMKSWCRRWPQVPGEPPQRLLQVGLTLQLKMGEFPVSKMWDIYGSQFGN